jgi:opacity protein-like surface antigen
MTRNSFKLVTVALVAAVSAVSLASHVIAADAPEPTLDSLHLTCSDFTHNDDGSWSPVRAISFNGVIMSPDVSYRKGENINGVKIVELLDNECVVH